MAAEQAYSGTQIAVEDAQPGDLVFYADESGDIYHVVIYAGNGETIEAQSSDTGIVRGTLDTADAVWVVRILEDSGYTLSASKPSVSVAVKELVKKGYALKDCNGNVCLTEKGKELAKNVYERHQYYKNLLIRAGVEPETAEKEGCALEHVLSNDSHRKLEKYIRDLERDN